MNALDRLSLPLSADSAQSSWTGLGTIGTGGDKSREAVPADPVWLTPQQMESATIVDTIIRRATYAIPEDAVAEGWRTDSGTRKDVTADIDEELLLEDRAEESDAMARHYGGSHLVFVIPGVDPRKPLPPGPHKVAAVHVLNAREAIPQEWCADLESPEWSRPEWWRLNPQRPGMGSYAGMMGRIHRSHMVYVPGLPMSRTQRVPGLPGYDLSVPQAYWERARDLGLAMRSAAIAAMEQSMVILSLKNGAGGLASPSRQQILDALDQWDLARSTKTASVVTGDNDARALDRPLSGLADTVRVQYEQLSAVEGIPLTVLLGMAPGGLTTDDESAMRNYEAFIKRHRRKRLTRTLLAAYNIILGPTERRTIYWPPVYQPTMAVRATTSLTLMQRDQVAVTIGAITPDESRARFRAEDGETEALIPVLGDDALLDEATPEDVAAIVDIGKRAAVP